MESSNGAARYGQSFGSAKTQEPLRFCIQPGGACARAVLSVARDGQQPVLREMDLTDEGGFVCTVSFAHAGLYFYSFLFFSDTGEVLPGCACGETFQLTVYDRAYVPPGGWAGGVMYQIFPDRFSISSQGVLPLPYEDRVLHNDLRDMPDFRPDASGRVRNRDFFGGNLRGIEEKLSYLEGLGVTCLYLNPIGEAHSNHRYDTADYKRVDPLLGTEEDFVRLCQSARARGIQIILDGVFSHTGDDSIYFNRYGRYDTVGAWQSESSPYYRWYTFLEYPHRYQCWWGFDTLPEIRETDPAFIDFICSEGGVLDYWLSLGAGGFRLDVADELPDGFIEKIRRAIKAHGEDKLLIGEVWEDASNKVSYGVRRRYLQGKELDSVMNYPFRTAILDFVRGADAELFMRRVTGIVRNYPKPMMDLMMNMLSTHDTERAITVLAFGKSEGRDREWQSTFSLSREDYLRGVEMLKLAMVLQFTLPGIPCIYYGDEIGMQGMRDPFNRAFMRWRDIDENLLHFTQKLALERRAHAAFSDGELVPLAARDGLVAYLRECKDGAAAVVLNRSQETRSLRLPGGKEVETPPWRYQIIPL